MMATVAYKKYHTRLVTLPCSGSKLRIGLPLYVFSKAHTFSLLLPLLEEILP
jgi:hypothetical protein